MIRIFGVTQDNKVEEVKFDFSNQLNYIKGNDKELDKIYVKKNKYLYNEPMKRPFILFNEESEETRKKMIEYIKKSDKKFDNYNQMNAYIEDNNREFGFTIGEMLVICSIFDELYVSHDKCTFIFN
jgi:hypothetical protein